jgi:hypothetical protein
MLDIVEKNKIVQALAPTTQGADDDGDYISMANAHAVWTIINIKKPTNAITFTPKTASAYAGTGSSAITGGARFWTNTNTTQLDRIAVSTATTAIANAATTNSQLIVCRYDPAAAPSSHPYFAMIPSTAAGGATGTLSMTYILESRFAGYQAFVATTSST